MRKDISISFELSSKQVLVPETQHLSSSPQLYTYDSPNQ